MFLNDKLGHQSLVKVVKSNSIISIPVKYLTNCCFIIFIEVKKAITIFDILKSTLLKFLLSDKQKETLNFILNNPNVLSQGVNDPIIKQNVTDVLRKCRSIFNVTNNHTLLFVLLSTIPIYLSCNKLTALEDKIMKLTIFGVSKIEITSEISVGYNSLSSYYRAIYKKLDVHSLEEAIIALLKETKSYKNPSDLEADFEKYEITIK
jgi:DNA-binding CsgD family transcriptional regulator